MDDGRDQYFPKWTGTPHSDRSALRRVVLVVHSTISTASSRGSLTTDWLIQMNCPITIGRSIDRSCGLAEQQIQWHAKRGRWTWNLQLYARRDSPAQIESDMGEGLEQYDSIEIGSKLRTFSNWSAHLPELIELYLIQLPGAEEEGYRGRHLDPSWTMRKNAVIGLTCLIWISLIRRGIIVHHRSSSSSSFHLANVDYLQYVMVWSSLLFYSFLPRWSSDSVWVQWFLLRPLRESAESFWRIKNAFRNQNGDRVVMAKIQIHI